MRVTYPKFKLGEEVVREVASPPTYGMQSNDGKYWSCSKSMTRLLILFFNAIKFPRYRCSNFARSANIL